MTSPFDLPTFDDDELDIAVEQEQQKARRARRLSKRHVDRYWLRNWFKRLWETIDHNRWRAVYSHNTQAYHRAGFGQHLRTWEMINHRRRERHRVKQALHQQQEIDAREFQERNPLT